VLPCTTEAGDAKPLAWIVNHLVLPVGGPMLTTLTKVFKNEDGATAIEYGLIAALIAVAAIAAFQLVGTNLSTVFNSIATKL
jgi:pilus assembly protein Flp/PilA